MAPKPTFVLKAAYVLKQSSGPLPLTVFTDARKKERGSDFDLGRKYLLNQHACQEIRTLVIELIGFHIYLISFTLLSLRSW